MTVLQEDVDFLEHYGVKGMQWGVRRARNHKQSSAEKKVNKQLRKVHSRRVQKKDEKFAKKADSVDVTLKVYNGAADRANRLDVNRINNKPAYKNADFTNDSPLRRKYYKEQQDAFASRLDESAASLGTNASGTKRYGVKTNKDGSWEVTLKDVEHASASSIFVQPQFDEMGHIVKLVVKEPSSIEHAGYSETGIMPEDADFLEHFGVKGMKWGVRKERFKRNRALNKASRAKDKEENKKAIDDARDYFRSGQAKAEKKEARAQYKANKDKLGSREARKILQANRDKRASMLEKSQELKDGKEVATYILTSVALDYTLKRIAS